MVRPKEGLAVWRHTRIGRPAHRRHHSQGDKSTVVSFAFTEEQQDFAKSLAGYARKVLLPGYRERAASAEFPFDVLRQLGELGVLGIGLPERYGGTGTDDPVLLGL